MIATSTVDIRFRLGLSLAYLGGAGVDANRLILDARSAVAKIANAATGALTISEITAAVLAVPGVVAIDNLRINGEPTDAVAATFETSTEYIRVNDVRIVP